MTQPTAGNALAQALSSSYALLRLALLALLAAWFASGIYVVPSHQVAVELRCGRPTGSAATRVNGPGVHTAWPRPIGEVVRVDVGRVQSLALHDFWYAPTAEEQRTGKPGVPGANLRPGVDGYLLTGDLDLVHGEWSLTYRVSDPAAWLFTAAEPVAMLRDLADSRIAQVVAGATVEGVLRDEQEALRQRVATLLAKRVEAAGLGVQIENVLLAQAIPARQVASAFDEALRAQQEGAKEVEAARADEAGAVARAEADGARKRSGAEALRDRTARSLAAEARVFPEEVSRYAQSPELYVRQHQAEALSRTFARCGKLVVTNRPEELRLNVPTPPGQPAPEEGGP
ncbi:MAG: protease modulator HflK [Armatimonadetes bacterium]|nr:protease modulator HflK [Armatimonadota bacterium]